MNPEGDSSDTGGVGTSWDVADAIATYNEYLDAMEKIRARDQWVHGHDDLMRVLGVEHIELLHSGAVGWLFDPGTRHGLSAALLTRILLAGWPHESLPDLRSATVDREIPLDKTRADIVVRCGSLVMVIENKIDSSERPCQCEDLYQEWTKAEPGSDARFLLLTLDGHAPTSTCTREAADAWRSMSYGSLRVALEDACAGADPSRPPTRGRSTVDQYIWTLHALGGPANQVEIRIGGGHVE